MSLDNLLLIIVVAFVAWRLASSFRARRRVPELKRVMNAGSWRNFG